MEEQKSYKSWTVSEEFWEVVKGYVPKRERDPKRIYKCAPGRGRKPIPPRKVLEGILYVLRTGCMWKALPKEFGSSSSIHQYFQEWQAAGFFRTIWSAGLMEYDELVGIDWEWQSVDGAMRKSPLGQEKVGPNPTDRGKKRGKAECVD
jgi:transposase